jgi:hypothetical protein
MDDVRKRVSEQSGRAETEDGTGAD